MREAMEMMEDKVQVKKHFSKIGWSFIAGIAVIYGLNYLLTLLCSQKPELLENSNIELILSMVPMYLLGMPFLMWLLHKLPATRLPKRKMKVSHFLLAFIICITLMYSSNLLGVLLTTIIGFIKGSAVENTMLSLLGETNLGLIFVFTVICAPVYEEMIFRKLLVDRTERFGQAVAVVLSGVMFGLFHGNLNQFVYATALGMFFAFIYIKTGKIQYTIGLHMLVNFMGGVLGMLMLRAMKYEEYMALAQAGASAQELVALVMSALPGWIMYMVYLLAVLCLGVTGLVLLIVYRKRLALPGREGDIPKGKRFSLVYLNAGMVCYCLFWIFMIICQLMKG